MTDLEILLYQYFCAMYSPPEENTVTSLMLERYCKETIQDNPNLTSVDIEKLINYRKDAVKILFSLPQIPTLNHPRFGL